MRIESDTENAKEEPAEQQQQQQQQRSSRSPQQQSQQPLTPAQAAGSKPRSGSQTVSRCNLIICANGRIWKESSKDTTPHKDIPSRKIRHSSSKT